MSRKINDPHAARKQTKRAGSECAVILLALRAIPDRFPNLNHAGHWPCPVWLPSHRTNTSDESGVMDQTNYSPAKEDSASNILRNKPSSIKVHFPLSTYWFFTLVFCFATRR